MVVLCLSRVCEQVEGRKKDFSKERALLYRLAFASSKLPSGSRLVPAPPSRLV